jgi:hypothetical protein
MQRMRSFLIVIALFLPTSAVVRAQSTTKPASIQAIDQATAVANQLSSDLDQLKQAKQLNDAAMARLQSALAASPLPSTSGTPVNTPTRWLVIFYVVPFIPFITRAFVCWKCRSTIWKPIPSPVKDEDTHRSASLGIGGFALTIFAGLVVLDTSSSSEPSLDIYFAAMSFVAYFLAHAIQGQKIFYIHDHVGDAAMDAGALCLVSALISLLLFKYGFGLASSLLCVAALTVWVAEHIMRIRSAYECQKGVKPDG